MNDSLREIGASNDGQLSPRSRKTLLAIKKSVSFDIPSDSTTNQFENESTNQSTNQFENQSTNPTNQSTNQSTNQFENQLTKQTKSPITRRKVSKQNNVEQNNSQSINRMTLFGQLKADYEHDLMNAEIVSTTPLLPNAPSNNNIDDDSANNNDFDDEDEDDGFEPLPTPPDALVQSNQDLCQHW